MEVFFTSNRSLSEPILPENAIKQHETLDFETYYTFQNGAIEEWCYSRTTAKVSNLMEDQKISKIFNGSSKTFEVFLKSVSLCK